MVILRMIWPHSVNVSSLESRVRPVMIIIIIEELFLKKLIVYILLFYY